MTGRFKQPIWILPLFIAGLVAVLGAWGSNKLRQTIEHQLQAQLASSLNANVTALEIWTTNQMRLATARAGDAQVRTNALRILDHSNSEPGPGGNNFNFVDSEQLFR
jgi:hypothetical protein